MGDMYDGAMTAALRRFFGFAGFRPGQADMIRAALEGRDSLGVMPTGGGKSVCYQLPAARSGTFTLVVTPLRALMRDQVRHLMDRGIPAALIDSGVTTQERSLIYDAARDGSLRLLYVAPERLHTPDFDRFAQTTRIDLIAVDEAHCVLQWGADFRPAYLGIGSFIESLAARGRRPVVMALTATATSDQADAIARLLHLTDPVRVHTGADRPNITLTVVQAKPKARRQLIREWAAGHSGCGIVYRENKRECERLADELRDMGVTAEAFHADLDDGTKRRIQDGFLAGSIRVICATSAFGMGIDKPDVRWVVNDGPCKSLEAFWQEAGRAGRDGKPADSILYWSPGDFVRLRQDVNDATAAAERSGDEDRIQAAQGLRRRLNAMSRYCDADRCLRGIILDTFDPGHDAAGTGCGSCSVCLHTPMPDTTAARRRARTPRHGDTHPAARTNPWETGTGSGRRMETAILDYVDALHAEQGHGVGASTLAAALTGSTAVRVIRQGLDRIHGYASLAGASQDSVRAAVNTLVERGVLSKGGDYNTIDRPERTDAGEQEKETTR